MKDMYEIVPRGNEYIYGKILLDNFNVCHSCRQFYPIDRKSNLYYRQRGE